MSNTGRQDSRLRAPCLASPDGVIDLQSEVAAGIDPQVRHALLTASDGSDCYDTNAHVHELEERVAATFGMAEALFMPTGRMANTVAIGVLSPEAAEVVLEARSHIMTSEYGMLARLLSLQSKTYLSPDGAVRVDQVLPLIAEQENRTLGRGVVAVEDTHLASGGVPQDVGVLRALSGHVRTAGRAMYCDGARLWHSMAATGQRPAAYGEIFDAISVSMVKGPGAPVGAVAVFARPQRALARDIRRMLGGGWAAPGALAAAALRALDVNLPELAGHCQRAAHLACLLSAELGPHRVRCSTNMVLFDVPRSDVFFDWCAERGLLLFRHAPAVMRAVVHAGVREQDIERAARIIAEQDARGQAIQSVERTG
ncbi:MAG TPA: beta-eliminating lyase-related protein [Streptosporangiaceae bacterium]|nr:beta-eliminating lyase-related protein [Streptosporangiaceae bacterium]